MIVLMNRQTQLKIAAMTALVLLLGIFSYSAVGVESISNDTTKDVIIKNVWVDVPLSQILRDISMETGVTISSCPHVPDPIISLDASKGRPLVECLHELVAGQGLFVYQKSKKFYLIICGEITCPTTMEVASSSRVYLKYISAKHLRASLPKAVQPYVTSGERENEVFVYAEPDISAHIMEMINQMDIPSQQVMLEVLVVDLWETTSDELGIDWSFSGPHTSFSMLDGVGSAGFTGLGSYASIAASNLVSINATLRALIEKNKASIRSRPRVATLNGQKATIDISLDEYYSIITDLNGSAFRTDLQVIKSGVMLQITPFIGDDDDITVNVLTEVSDVASRQNSSGNSSTSSGDLPVIRRRKADTCVRVKEGDAIVIGGLVETQENTDHKRVPLLSSIPGAGGLFKSKQDSKTKKEVIIFITPQLIREGQEVPASERHKLINEANEIGNLRSTAFNTRNENNKKIRNTDEEIKSLNAAVNLLGSQNQTDNVSYGITDADLSNQDKTYEINRERKVLQEAINLLDDKNEQVPCITTSPKNKNEASLGAISK
jgi:Flp pilus assembly secretin CpaC